MKAQNCLAIVAIGLLVPLAAFSQYETFDYPGATQTWLTGMNDQGDFVGYYDDGNGIKGFYVVGTDTFYLHFPGSQQTWAYGITNSDKIVGKYNTTGNGTDNEGFMYDYNTAQYTDITTPVISGGDWTQVLDMNESGCWAGNYRVGTSAEMMSYCDGGTFNAVQYNVLPTYGTAINSAGHLAGYYIDGANIHSFIWTGPGLFTPVDMPGNIKTRIWGMNDNYIVVGDYANSQGFIYDGFIQGGNTYEQIQVLDAVTVIPQDINNNNQICGYYTDANGMAHGFLIRSYDLKFRPNPDGWHFPNSQQYLWTIDEYGDIIYVLDPYLKKEHGITAPFPSWQDHFPEHVPSNKSFPSWTLFVQTFSEIQTYNEVNGVLKMKPAAYQFWLDNKTDKWKGSCYGMSYTSLMYFDNHSWFEQNYPYMPPGIPSVFSVDPDTNSRQAINETHIYQMTTVQKNWQFSHMTQDNPTTTLNLIKNMMIDGVDDDFAVSINKTTPGETGGHSLVPFKIESEGVPGWEDVYVYDNNYPDDTLRKIRVNKQTTGGGAWYYEGSLNSGGNPEEWGGPDAHWGFYIGRQVSDQLGAHNIGTAFMPHDQNRTSGYIETYFSTKADEYILNGSNDTIGDYDGHIAWGSSFGVPVINLTGYKGPPAGYLLDENGTYSAKIENADTNYVYMDVFLQDQVLGFSRDDADSTQSDDLDYSTGLTYTNPDVTTKKVSFKAYINVSGTSYHFWLDSIPSEQNSQLHIEPENSNELKVTNTGSATHYKLTISILSDNDASMFEIDSVPFAENAIHHIIPFWNNLGGDSLYILLDTGTVGTIDDTLFLENQAHPRIGLSDGIMQFNNWAGNDTIFVINSGAGTLNWNVSSMPSWVTITSGSSGMNDGQMRFDYAENTGPNRSGWLIINSNDANSPDSVKLIQGDNIVTGGPLLSDEDLMVVYPNPANDLLNIGFADRVENAQVSLWDISGRKVFAGEYKKASGQLLKIDVSSFAKGLYMLETQCAEERVVKKVVLE